LGRKSQGGCLFLGQREHQQLGRRPNQGTARPRRPDAEGAAAERAAEQRLNVKKQFFPPSSFWGKQGDQMIL
jgi:hypothetical protein